MSRDDLSADAASSRNVQSGERCQPVEFGNITVRDLGVEVVEADDYALVSLELVALSDQRLLHVKSGRLSFCDVEYEVIGWDDQAKALQVAKVTHG